MQTREALGETLFVAVDPQPLHEIVHALALLQIGSLNGDGLDRCDEAVSAGKKGNALFGPSKLVGKHPFPVHLDLQTRERPRKTRGDRQGVETAQERFTGRADPDQLPIDGRRGRCEGAGKLQVLQLVPFA